jgi:hypothetical protein
MGAMKNLLNSRSIVISTLPLLVALIHIKLATSHIIRNDEGVALYTGRVILEGGAPYVDSWDHKGPIFYLLNAFGLWLSPGALWGPGVVEGLFLAFALAVLCHRLNKVWQPYVIFCTLLAFLGSYYLFLESLDLTESWTLPFQIFAYLIIFQASDYSPRILHAKISYDLCKMYFLLGINFSLIFYIRPNNATGILLATLALSLIKHRAVKFYVWTVFISTFIAFSTLIFAYLKINQSFNLFLEQYFIYNFDYSSAGSISDRIGSSTESIFKFALSPLSVVLILAIGFIFFDKTTKVKMPYAIVIGFIGDMISSCLSARGYLHYMIVTLPSLIFILGNLHSTLKNRQAKLRHFMNVTLLVFIVFGAVLGPQKISDRFQGDPGNLVGITKFISSNTNPSDFVQILGSETRVLVLTYRQSASSMTYSHPATSYFYRNQVAAIDTLESDIKERRPKYILRSTSGACKFDNASCKIGGRSYREDKLKNLYLWVLNNYERVGTIGAYEIWQSKLLN